MPRRRDGGSLHRGVEGLARRSPPGLEYLDRVAASLAASLDADRVQVWLIGDDDDADAFASRLHAFVLGEVVSAADLAGGGRAGAPARLSAPVLVFGVPVGTVDVERRGLYDWSVRDLRTAGDHGLMIGVALEWLLVEQASRKASCRSTA